MEQIKILVVDDESRMRKLVRDFLEREGYQVLEAGDGMEAMEIFYEDKDIALIILDVYKRQDNTLDIQEFMIMPIGACCYQEGLRMCVEIYHILRGLLKEQGYGTAVGDEGGFAPDLSGAKEALRFLVKAVETAGYQPGKEVGLALDVAASELYDLQSGKYVFRCV